MAHQYRVGETEGLYWVPLNVGRVYLEEAQKLLADHKWFFLHQKYYEQGESAGHLLDTIVRSQLGSTHITKLVSNEGVEVTESADILKVSVSYYKKSLL